MKSGMGKGRPCDAAPSGILMRLPGQVNGRSDSITMPLTFRGTIAWVKPVHWSCGRTSIGYRAGPAMRLPDLPPLRVP